MVVAVVTVAMPATQDVLAWPQWQELPPRRAPRAPPTPLTRQGRLEPQAHRARRVRVVRPAKPVQQVPGGALATPLGHRGQSYCSSPLAASCASKPVIRGRLFRPLWHRESDRQKLVMCHPNQRCAHAVCPARRAWPLQSPHGHRRPIEVLTRRRRWRFPSPPARLHAPTHAPTGSPRFAPLIVLCERVPSRSGPDPTRAGAQGRWRVT